MKIVIFTDTFLPSIDGVVTATLTIAKGLADRGHKIIIVAPKYKSLFRFKYKNIEVIRIKSLNAFFHPSFRTTRPLSPGLYLKLKKKNVDVVHIQTPWTVGLEGILFAKVSKLPLIGTYHTYVADKDYLKNVKMDYTVVENFMWRYSLFYYNRCDIVTCPSDFTKKELIVNGCKPTTKFISNGANSADFGLSKIDLKKKYDCKGPLLLSVGRISVEKNIRHMLLAMKEVIIKFPLAKLMIVGDGPYFKQMKEEIKELGLQKNVILMGKIVHDKLLKLGIYKAADLFVITSKTETGPITVLEAYANGLPCIGVNAKNLGYIINNNVSGLVVNPENPKDFAKAIIKCLSNKKFYDKLKKGIVKELKKHDIELILDEWEKTYKKAIEKNNEKQNIIKKTRAKLGKIKGKTKSGFNKVKSKLNNGRKNHE